MPQVELQALRAADFRAAEGRLKNSVLSAEHSPGKPKPLVESERDLNQQPSPGVLGLKVRCWHKPSFMM